jgi:hypothetical protein
MKCTVQVFVIIKGNKNHAYAHLGSTAVTVSTVKEMSTERVCHIVSSHCMYETILCSRTNKVGISLKFLTVLMQWLQRYKAYALKSWSSVVHSD